jgi:hypothetical protein
MFGVLLRINVCISLILILSDVLLLQKTKKTLYLKCRVGKRSGTYSSSSMYGGRCLLLYCCSIITLCVMVQRSDYEIKSYRPFNQSVNLINV